MTTDRPAAAARNADRAVGFVGTGIMGRSMAGHLLAAGYDVHVFNRTRSKTEPLLAAGARWHDTPGGVAEASDVVITMVGMPSDVEEVYFGGTEAVPEGSGLIARSHPGGLLTLHANSAADALTRLEDLCLEAAPAPPQRLIRAAVDLVVFIERTATGRRIAEVRDLRVASTAPEGEKHT
jgi:uncharacterized protein YbjT (DUF2867 family)